MAELLNKIPTNLTEYPNSFKRQGAFPLEAYEVQYSLSAAQTYAASDPLAYVGQTIAVVENNEVTLYIIADAAGTLKEVGSATNGDGKTITLKDGVLSLFGIDGKAEGTFVPSLVNGVLTWAEPDTSTAEGQQQAINALDARASALELTVNGKAADEEAGTEAVIGLVEKVAANTQAIADEVAAREAAIGKATEGDVAATGVYAAIEAAEARAKAYADANDDDTKYDDTALAARVKVLEDNPYDDTELAGRVSTLEGVVGDAESGLVKGLADEIARAKEAERVLDEAIKAIDFIDADELADAIKDFTTKNYVDGEIDKIEEAIGKLNHFTATVVSSIDEVKDIGVLYLIKDETVAGVDKYNEYIVVDGAPILIGDTTTDLSNYYNKTEIDGKVETLEGAIADEVDAREALDERVVALEAKPFETYATKSEVEAVDSKFADYTTTADLNTALDGKYDKAEGVTIGSDGLNGTIDLRYQDGGAEYSGQKVSFNYSTANDYGYDYNSTSYDMYNIVNTTSFEASEPDHPDNGKSYTVRYNIPKASETNNGTKTLATVEDIDAKIAAENISQYAKTSYVDTELAKKADLSIVYTKSEMDTKIGTPGVPAVKDTEGNVTTEAIVGTGIFASTYSKAELNAMLDEIEGGSTESAASVARQLDAYIASNNKEVADLKTEQGTQNTAIATAQSTAESGVSKAEAAQAKANEVGTALGVLETNKVDKNTSAIAGLQGTISGEGGLISRVALLETDNTNHKNEFTTLNTKVKEVVETTIPAINVKVAANESAISTINGTLTTQAELIATKADKENTYTKTEVDAKVKEVKDAFEAIDHSIYAEKANVYTKGEVDNLLANLDQTELENGIATNAADIAVLVGNDKDENGRANKSIRAIAAAEIERLIQVADEGDDGHTIQSIQNLVDYVEANAGEIAELITATGKNTAKLAGIEEGTTVKAYVDAAIEAIPEYELPVATADTLGGIKSTTGDNKVSVDTDGVASVASVNVNTLVQDEDDVLILNGGTATV